MPRNSWSNSKADDTLDLELTADQNRLLFRALVSSYTDFTKIRIMVFRDLHDPLDGIPPNLDKESGVMALMQWAKAEGKVQELSGALIADKPGNQSDGPLLNQKQTHTIGKRNMKQTLLVPRCFQWLAPGRGKSKSQNPNPKQTPRSQIPKSGDAAVKGFGMGYAFVQSRSRGIECRRFATGLSFGLWNLFGIWDLDFGISAREFGH